jgi:UDP-glucose 4-epimerase
MFTDKVLLITSGTGTFGNAVLNRFLSTGIKEIRVFSRDEKKKEDMRISYDHPKLKFYIADVRNPSSVADAMTGVDYVFHAAALKAGPFVRVLPAGSPDDQLPRLGKRDERRDPVRRQASHRAVDRQGCISD